MDSYTKNLLDLKHTFYLAKASLFFSVGVGGAIAIFFGLKEINQEQINTIIATIWLIPFIERTITNFVKCNKIQEEIKKASTINFYETYLQ